MFSFAEQILLEKSVTSMGIKLYNKLQNKITEVKAV
jgi:hypothetical protein